MVFFQNVLSSELTPEVIKKCKLDTEASDKEQFIATFDILVKDMVAIMKEESGVAEEAVAWFEESMKVNVMGGKMNRGLSVLHTYRRLVSSRPLTVDETFKCFVLGWCVEWLQAYFLVADDLMDGSITRRGQPCWYKRPLVGTVAINDSFMLEMCIYKLLKLYFGTEPYYIDLVELFLQTTWQTEIGQLHDLITAPVGVVDLNRFTLKRYKLIVLYKTAFYSFFLPVAEAMIMAGRNDKASLDFAKKVLLFMGEYFQVQDDYLDCYGAPEIIGKIGTDIQDNKCGWLVVQALSLANEEQRKVLEQNYAKHDPKCVEAIKKLYRELNLETVFKQYEEKTYKELQDMISECPQDLPKEIFEDFATKIFKRTK